MERLLYLPRGPAPAESEASARPQLAEARRVVEGLRAREPWAAGELVRTHGGHVQRVLARILGPGDPDRDDALQEVFGRAFENISALEDPAALRAWLTTLAVYTAREFIRRRRRRRWLTFHEDPPDLADPTTYPSDSVREAARCVYAVFGRMPADERVCLALRALEGLELTELATVCGTSLSTFRRRLTRAERRFRKLARDYEALGPWVNG